MARAGIGFGIHGNGANAHAPRGLDDAAGDFTPVCDQDFVKHGCTPGRNRLGTLRVQCNLAAPLCRCAAGLRGWQSEFL
jgi:hypothetical protein